MSDLRDLEQDSTTVREVRAFVGKTVRLEDEVLAIRSLRYSHGTGWVLDLEGRDSPVEIASVELVQVLPPMTSAEAFQAAADAKRRLGRS